jgi:hypothetical protein
MRHNALGVEERRAAKEPKVARVKRQKLEMREKWSIPRAGWKRWKPAPQWFRAPQ